MVKMYQIYSYENEIINKTNLHVHFFSGKKLMFIKKHFKPVVLQMLNFF